MTENATKSAASARSQGRTIDWPIVAFFVLAYLIAWIFIPVLNAIAERSGIADTDSLIRMAEACNLATPSWSCLAGSST